MGIIISSFPGCGREYLIHTHGDKAKMLDAVTDSVDDYDKYVDEVMSQVDDYDIVFIPSGEDFINAFNERNIDYDLFYPSKERRGEFIENAVRKRMKPNSIMILDRNFFEWVDKLDAIESENCYKHKMTEQGHFIGNDVAIMQYINNINQTPNTNEQSKGMEESSRGESDNEENEG